MTSREKLVMWPKCLTLPERIFLLVYRRRKFRRIETYRSFFRIYVYRLLFTIWVVRLLSFDIEGCLSISWSLDFVRRYTRQKKKKKIRRVLTKVKLQPPIMGSACEKNFSGKTKIKEFQK